MKLDRNINGTGRGKYGLVLNRRLQALIGPVGDSRNAKNMDEVALMKIRDAVQLLLDEGVIDWGDKPETEFFVMRLKDRHALPALQRYSRSVSDYGDDIEYAQEVLELTKRAGQYNPFCKQPD